MKKIYYSRSNDVNDEPIKNRMHTALHKHLGWGSYILSEYERDTEYTAPDWDTIDLVVVGSKGDGQTIGKGCYDEMHEAVKHSIPIIIIGVSGKIWFQPTISLASRIGSNGDKIVNWSEYAYLSGTDIDWEAFRLLLSSALQHSNINIESYPIY